MKQIYAKTKTLLLLLTLLTLGAWNTATWGGNTWIGNVAVGSGKGSATVTVYTYPLGVKSKQDDATSTNSTLQSATYTSRFSSTDGIIEFTSSAAKGYTFYAWYSNSACTKDESKSTTFTKGKNRGENTTRYAKFTPNEYTINFFSEVGSTTKIGSATVTYDAKYNKGTGWLESMTKSGYTFDGWYKNDGTTLIKGTDVVNITSNTALYAHWKANSYVVTLESNVATNHGTESFDVTYDAITPASITPPSRDKYTFWGYYTGENGEGTQIIDRDGKVLKSKSGYTDGNCKWKYAGNITLHAHLVAKKDQTLTWDNVTNGNEYTTGTPGAVASSKLTVTYTYDHEEWAYINVNNRLVVEEPNKTVTITAHQDGNDYYNAAEPISRTFVTLGGHPNQYMDVQASNITYGDLLSDATLSGNVYLDGVVIPGTLEWVDPSIMPDAGTDEHMVLFTPTNTDAYSSVYFNVDVTVAKADPVFSWHISNALHEHTRFHDFVTSSNKETGFTYSVSDDTYIEVVDDGVLHTKEVESAQSNLKITVKQAETANYNMKEETKTVTVYPKVEQCLPAVINSETVMNHMGKVFDPANAGSWCDVTNVVDTTYLRIFDVKYTQYRGIRLGKWSEGFSGVTNIYEAFELVKNWNLPVTDKSIELTFTGIPDKISFSARLQTVQYKFVEWQTAPLGTAPVWKIYEKSLGGEYEEVTSLSVNDTENHLIEANLKPTTRFVKIELSSAFAGFAQNVTITRKQSIETDKASLIFGTNANPLQQPQVLTLTYSSIGDCDGETDENIVITSSNPAFYVDEPVITENVGVEQMDNFVIRVRCNDVNQTGTLTITGSDGTTATVALSSEKPVLTVTPTSIFETGTEHEPVENTAYRAMSTHSFSACFDAENNALFDTLYIYGVTESAAASREWVMDAHKGYKVPAIDVTTGNVHTPCFVYKKEGAQYAYVRTFDAATKTLDITTDKKLGFAGYKPASLATNTSAIKINGSDADIYLNHVEILASGAVMVLSGANTIHARWNNNISSASNSAVQLAGATTLTIEDSWVNGETPAMLTLQPAAGHPSIDLGSANGIVVVNGTQLELHNATNMAIAHMEGTTEHFDGEVHINDGTIIGEETLGMPKRTFIDGGTFNSGTVVAYTLKGKQTRPRNSKGETLSRQPMSPEDLVTGYSWYGHNHLMPDYEAKVNPMLMDAEVWIFNGDAGEGYSTAGSWNKGDVPSENDDVLINAPMVVSGGEMKVRSLTINWEDKGKGIPAVTVNPDGGLTVGEGGVDMLKLTNPVENLVLKADQEAESATKGQTGYLRIHPNSAEPMPQATVELFSTTWYNKSNEAGNTTRFQCIGTPIEADGILASEVFPTGTLLYAWNEDTEKWKNSRSKALESFKGYDLSQKISNDGLLVEFAGLLVSGDKTIDLSYTEGKGLNLLANSYAAPIDIESFETEDFVNSTATIYILNAGTKLESDEQKGGLDAAGKWLGMPIETISELKGAGYPSIIPSMQGFWIQAKGENAQLKLDYARLVYNDDVKGIHENKPLRTPKRNNTQDKAPITGKLKIDIYGGGDADCLFILESESYDAAYEDGFDARKIASETMDIFTVRDSDLLGVDATNNIAGTRVGVRTGDTTAYVMSFSHLLSDRELFFLDNETGQTIKISEGTKYAFFAQPNSVITDRFVILAVEKAPEISTGVDSTKDDAKVHKFIKDNQLYILKNGVLYNAVGARVH